MSRKVLMRERSLLACPYRNVMPNKSKASKGATRRHARENEESPPLAEAGVSPIESTSDPPGPNVSTTIARGANSHPSAVSNMDPPALPVSRPHAACIRGHLTIRAQVPIASRVNIGASTSGLPPTRSSSRIAAMIAASTIATKPSEASSSYTKPRGPYTDYWGDPLTGEQLKIAKAKVRLEAKEKAEEEAKAKKSAEEAAKKAKKAEKKATKEAEKAPSPSLSGPKSSEPSSSATESLSPPPMRSKRVIKRTESTFNTLCTPYLLEDLNS